MIEIFQFSARNIFLDNFVSHCMTNDTLNRIWDDCKKPVFSEKTGFW